MRYRGIGACREGSGSTVSREATLAFSQGQRLRLSFHPVNEALHRFRQNHQSNPSSQRAFKQPAKRAASCDRRFTAVLDWRWPETAQTIAARGGGVARIRVFLPTACSDRAVFGALAGRLCAATNSSSKLRTEKNETQAAASSASNAIDAPRPSHKILPQVASSCYFG